MLFSFCKFFIWRLYDLFLRAKLSLFRFNPNNNFVIFVIKKERVGIDIAKD
jgi:hypothetical protein